MISKNTSTVNWTPFTNQLWKSIEQNIEEIKRTLPPPYIAAFDADGTLWPGDLGRMLYAYKKHNSLLNYSVEELDKKHMELSFDPDKLHIWQAELYQNLSIETVLKWATQSRSEASHVSFLDQKKLIRLLIDADFDVYVVSASFRYAILDSAIDLGVTEKNVLGIELPIKNNLFQPPAKTPATTGDGKIKALLEKTNQVYPMFCSGNSMGDFDLLKNSQHTRLIINSADPSNEMYKTEQNLFSEAKKQNWLIHQFQ